MGSLRKSINRVGGLAALAAGILLSSVAPAQQAPSAPQLINNFRQSWCRVDVASGRVTLRMMQQRSTQSTSTSGTRVERITIRAMGGADPAVDYSLTTSDEDFTLRFSSANHLEIHRAGKGNSTITAVDYDQPPTGPVTLKVGGKEPHEYKAASLWHLVLEEPDTCRQTLLPLLGLLRGNWDLSKISGDIRAALLRMAESDVRSDQTQWAQWVQQLGDEQFTKREAADRQLRDAGRVIVSYLQQLDTTRLDAEQQFRIRRIINALTVANGDDTPEQVASLLFGDASIWLAMLSSPEESTRKAAARRLGAIRGGPVAFDPAADLQTRKKQIEALKGKG